tara:strand:- start:6922 stop:9645 length:2724 start_codon:yes stop_codon:yes gene_type:complete
MGRQRAALAVTEKSELEKDLGIDSIGKVELFHEIEDQFDIYLPDDLLATAVTVEDLTQAIEKSHPATSRHTLKRALLPKRVQYQPKNEKSIVEILRQWAKHEPNRPHIYLQQPNGDELTISYKTLLDNSLKVAANLYQMGIRQYDTVAIMLPTCEGFFYSFMGAQLLGAIPVPIYPPFRPDKLEEYTLREVKILKKAGVKTLITFDKAEKLSELLGVFIPSLKKVVTYEQVSETKKKAPEVKLTGEHSALIQFTSGSTSDPKGVLLSHYNLMSNISAIGKAMQIQPSDVVVSWLPLYHDMGLIGCWLAPLYYGRPVVIMSPLQFLTRPERWLWAIHYHRATISAGPNFSYDLCVKRVKPESIEGLDLSSWRLALNGAEAVNPNTVESFIQKFKTYGFNENAYFPVYGLAESCVAVCFPPLDRPPIIDVINQEDYQTQQIATPVKNARETNVRFVCCGKAIPEHQIRVVDGDNKLVPDRVIGSLQFQGPSTMQGYYDNAKATSDVMYDSWCDTGDFAYLVDGEVYITGRKKDIIIKAGRNLYPEVIEEVASQVEGVRKGCVAAFGVSDAQKGTEKLIIVAETRTSHKREKQAIIQSIIENVTSSTGMPPDEVILVKPQAVPKTSSGKLQRAQCKQYYERKQLTGLRMPLWVQIGKLALKGFCKKIINMLGVSLQFFYTLYVWCITVGLLAPAVLSVFILPGNASRAIARNMSKLILFLSGNRLSVENKALLQDNNQPVILVANHTSYADAPILYSLLPNAFSFVVKKEVAKFPLAKTILRKHRHILVSRMDFSESLEETQQIIHALEARRSIAIFPEGTFTAAAGLKNFKFGAFKVAAESQVPICPVGIKGSRQIIKSGQWLLRPSHIQVVISDLIYPQGSDWDAVVQLQTETRAIVSKLCGEPLIEE